MEIREKDAKVIILSGKARSGKDTTMKYLKELYESDGLEVINIGFSDYIKDYVRKITGWDGKDETKPRELLQVIGTDIIREKIDKKFFINRVIQDIHVYSFFFDIIIINDARFINEIESIKEEYKDAISININRPNYDNELTEKEKNHKTEVDLDGYNKYDYIIENNSSLEEYKDKIRLFYEEVLK